jgi:hypothetical protein
MKENAIGFISQRTMRIAAFFTLILVHVPQFMLSSAKNVSIGKPVQIFCFISRFSSWPHIYDCLIHRICFTHRRAQSVHTGGPAK